MESLHWERHPDLRRPVLVIAFEGWNDAGDGASAAAAYLARRWRAVEIASIDPEEFYDFTATRPEVRIEDESTRVIEWPRNEFSVAALPGLDRDVVFLRGVEPQLRWRTFCGLVIDVARTLGVELVVSLGALLAEVPHTRPVRVTGTAADHDLVERLGLRPSRYEGPTGILGVLGEAFGRTGIPHASLWASVPAYVGQTPSPKATLALVGRLAELLGVAVPTVDLDVAAAAYERQVSEVVEADDDARAYVRSLEEVTDGGREVDTDDDDIDDSIIDGSIINSIEVVDDLDEADLPGGDRLAEEVERYLRDQET